MKCVLPFTLDVEMKTYHNIAFPLGVIKANIADYDMWLCNKLIQMSCRINDGHYYCAVDDIWSVADGLTFEQKALLAPDTLKLSCIDIIELSKAMIEKGYYINGNYNEFYIPQKSPYGQYDYKHDYIIFGYDDSQKVFHSAAYLETNKYDFFDIKYDDYYKGVSENKADLTRFNYYKIAKRHIESIDTLSIKAKLNNYIHSRWDPLVNSGNPGEHIYGINAWDTLSNCVLTNKDFYLDRRYGRLFMEHRHIMHKRIKKLQELSLVKRDDLADLYYDNVLSKAEIVHFMFIKYNLTHSNEILPRIAETITQVNNSERVLLGELAHELD